MAPPSHAHAHAHAQAIDDDVRQQVEAEVSKAGAAAMAALQCKTMEEKVRENGGGGYVLLGLSGF